MEHLCEKIATPSEAALLTLRCAAATRANRSRKRAGANAVECVKVARNRKWPGASRVLRCPALFSSLPIFTKNRWPRCVANKAKRTQAASIPADDVRIPDQFVRLKWLTICLRIVVIADLHRVHNEGKFVMRTRRQNISIALCVAVFVIAGCKGGQEARIASVGHTGGSADRGEATIVAYQCGKCHTIPGIRSAHGVFGPPLEALSRRTYIGGNFPNTSENLVHWIMNPQAMKPRTAMPDLGLSEQQSRDAAAYLYTLK
jgi:cytochrome c2